VPGDCHHLSCEWSDNNHHLYDQQANPVPDQDSVALFILVLILLFSPIQWHRYLKSTDWVPYRQRRLEVEQAGKASKDVVEG
jgi:hypothetical protein